MEFNAPATENLFDRAKLVGKSTPRIDGPLKVSGAAPYAAERHDVVAGQAYGWIVGAAIASFLFGIIGISFGGWFGYLIAGLIGACILIALVRAVRR